MTLDCTPQRILIIRPSALGDVCRSVGVLASLRRGFPQAHVAWLVQNDFAAAIEAHPALNEVVGFARQDFARWWRSPRAFAALLRWLRQLRGRGFDLVLDCQGLARSGLMTWMTGADVRVGLRAAREFGWLGYNRRAPSERGAALPRHSVDEMFLLVRELGIEVEPDLRLYVPAAHSRWWDEQRERLGIDGTYAVLAPTARWPSKRWPIDRFAQLIEPLHLRGFSKCVVIGAPGEADQVQPLCEQQSQSSMLINLVGRATIGQTMAVIARAGLVIANDSAPLHMAVGFERPLVGLYGPTDPEVVGPYGRSDSVVRGYQPRAGETINYKDPKLGDSLMRFISHVAVLQAVDRALASHASQLERVGKAQAVVEARS